MRTLIIRAAMAVALSVSAAGADAAASAPLQALAQSLAPGVWLLPGDFPPKREPDGNTVIFRAPQGLIVLDTGRHPWHRGAILDFARDQRVPIVAIVNSHWHLDHTSGNAELKRAYPGARVYASSAIEGALKGFLPKSAAETRKYLEAGPVDPETAEDLRGDIAVIEDPAALKPDVVIDRSRNMALGGRRLEVHLARNAATAGDVWLYDRKTRIAAVGDLVTLPAPFLDTACPSGWRKALGEIWTTPFQTAIPGHGPALTRADFASYRTAFDALIDCAGGPRAGSACAADWTAAVSPLLEPGDLALKRAGLMTESYVELLRMNAGASPFCETDRKT